MKDSLPFVESLYGEPTINFIPGDVEKLNSQTLTTNGYLPVSGGRATFSLFGKRFNANRFNVNQAPDPDVNVFIRTCTVGGSADWRRQFTRGEMRLHSDWVPMDRRTTCTSESSTRQTCSIVTTSLTMRR